VMQCVCARANKCSGRQITGRADTSCKQGERRRRPTGNGLSCEAGMRTLGDYTLPRESIVAHLGRTTSYGGESVIVSRQRDTL
jgi:hypothetical protein